MAFQIRNVEVNGQPGCAVRVGNGRVEAIGPDVSDDGRPQFDGRGGAVIPGLRDHHLHLYAAAAARSSLRLDAVSRNELGARLAEFARGLDAGAWIRAVGFRHPNTSLDRYQIDEMVGDRPVRIQHASGALWMLNSAAIDRLEIRSDLNASVEIGPDGRPSGRIWRGDDWLRRRMRGRVVPSLSGISRDLARWGVTGVADASVTNDAGSVALLKDAIVDGALVQRLMVMSGGAIEPPPSPLMQCGPVKLVLDEARLPDLDVVAARMDAAHCEGRAVAVHCVTASELALALAGFALAGAGAGDRIEHGAILSDQAIVPIRDMGLTVVTQPIFIAERGDFYRQEVDVGDQPFLYPCGRLLQAGVPVAGSSDAPYGSLDPWQAMRAATVRRSPSGHVIGPLDIVSPSAALALYLGALDKPGTPLSVTTGMVADLCLLDSPLDVALQSLRSDLPAMTVVAGRIVMNRLETSACA